jgi:hypothetical protein
MPPPALKLMFGVYVGPLFDAFDDRIVRVFL